MDLDQDDSPWADDGLEATRSIASAEYAKLSKTYNDAGYREGITAGKAARLQQGFDEGFVTAVPLARRVGHLRGIAASLLAILTTSAGTKHASSFLARLPEQREELVVRTRALVKALGRLDEAKVLPPDLEAEAHAAEHGEILASQNQIDKKDMASLESGLEGMFGGAAKKEQDWRLDECEQELRALLDLSGLDKLLPAHTH